MKFTSTAFLLFLPTVLVIYWWLRDRRAQNILLIAASYAFYAWWDVRFCSLMVISTIVDYSAGLAIQAVPNKRSRHLWLAFSCVANLGMLGVFKYYDFFVVNLHAALNTVGIQLDIPTLSLVLPVGISFYTFQTMSYTIDVYRRQLEPCRSVIDYAVYVSFFPQLVAGPIERGSRLLPQFQNDRTFDANSATDGCRQILWGLFKKMVIADNLASYIDSVYSAPTAFSGPQLALATACFAFQIYYDFSAYSDIAIGTARLFGFNLMRNFAYPYFSQDLAEFWRRWHISLSTWFRDYLYIPIGGSRGTTLRTAVNVMTTFILSGLWHGPSWNFAIWGAINGVAVTPTVLWSRRTALRDTDTPGGQSLVPRPGTLLRMAGVFGVACCAWVFFRAETFGDALLVFEKITAAVLDPSQFSLHTLGLKKATAALLAGVVVVEWITRAYPHPLCTVERWPAPARWTVYTALLWTIPWRLPATSSPFIYFQF